MFVVDLVADNNPCDGSLLVSGRLCSPVSDSNLHHPPKVDDVVYMAELINVGGLNLKC
jgi:hypothetical protein